MDSIKSAASFASGFAASSLDKANQMRGTELEKKVKLATSLESWNASSTLKNEIASATFDYQGYKEVMGMLWKRMFDMGRMANWKITYKALLLLDHLLKSGSEKVVEEARGRSYSLQDLQKYQATEDGKDQGKNVRHKAKQLVEFIKDDKALRAARKEASRNKGKFQGLSSDGGTYGGMGSGSGSSYGNGGLGSGAFGNDDDEVKKKKKKKKKHGEEKKKKKKKEESDEDEDESEEEVEVKKKSKKKGKTKKHKKKKKKEESTDEDEDEDDSEEEETGKKKKKKGALKVKINKKAKETKPRRLSGPLGAPPGASSGPTEEDLFGGFDDAPSKGDNSPDFFNADFGNQEANGSAAAAGGDDDDWGAFDDDTPAQPKAIAKAAPAAGGDLLGFFGDTPTPTSAQAPATSSAPLFDMFDTPAPTTSAPASNGNFDIFDSGNSKPAPASPDIFATQSQSQPAQPASKKSGDVWDSGLVNLNLNGKTEKKRVDIGSMGGDPFAQLPGNGVQQQRMMQPQMGMMGQRGMMQPQMGMMQPQMGMQGQMGMMQPQMGMMQPQMGMMQQQQMGMMQQQNMMQRQQQQKPNNSIDAFF